MAYIGELFLKVKLNGLGWDNSPDSKLAYERLQQAIADFIQKDENYVSSGGNKTVGVIICRELDHEGLHSIEGQGFVVQQGGKIPTQGRFAG